jgi:Ni,Fe-hydrogenase III large subunit
MSSETSRLADVTLGRALPLDEIPLLSEADFQNAILFGVARGWRVASLFGVLGNGRAIQLFVILADDEENHLYAGRMPVEGDGFASLTPRCPQVHLFEREIAEQFGLVPRDHPWLNPVRYHHSWTGKDAWHRDPSVPILPGVHQFYRVEGDQVHEVSVGPVHAGIIEPGHFRFQCHGEQVFHLEIALGFQHRGIEKSLIGGPDRRTRHFMETLAGDTTVAHTTNYSQILESLSGTHPSARAQILRGIALELERLANHVGDLGALSGDTGFLPTASFCGRIRGDFLNLTALLCGNRFGRDFIVPGGVGFEVDEQRARELLKRLAVAETEATSAINLLWENQSVMARFENIGRLSQASARELGIVGPAARATGLARDVRFNQPSGIFRLAQIPVSTFESGDVFARAYVRWLEIQQSLDFIRDQLGTLPPGDAVHPLGRLEPASLAVALNEGWRGEVCHTAITDEQGRLARYKVVDPSFHNWYALAFAMRNQEISDFPLCNKSFNLSYCGHDL